MEMTSPPVPLSVCWKETVTQCFVRLQVKSYTVRFTDCCQPFVIPVLNGLLLIVIYQYLFMRILGVPDSRVIEETYSPIKLSSMDCNFEAEEKLIL
jgi:hypothetical protein